MFVKILNADTGSPVIINLGHVMASIIDNASIANMPERMIDLTVIPALVEDRRQIGGAMLFQCECQNPRCARGNHPAEAARCLNCHGQQNLFSDEVIRLRSVGGVALCDNCLPKPIASPSNFSAVAWNNDHERLSKQATLWEFE